MCVFATHAVSVFFGVSVAFSIWVGYIILFFPYIENFVRLWSVTFSHVFLIKIIGLAFLAVYTAIVVLYSIFFILWPSIPTRLRYLRGFVLVRHTGYYALTFLLLFADFWSSYDTERLIMIAINLVVTVLGIVLSIRPLRARFVRLLARAGTRDATHEQSAAVIATLIGGNDGAMAIRIAKELFRSVVLQDLCADDFTAVELDPQPKSTDATLCGRIRLLGKLGRRPAFKPPHHPSVALFGKSALATFGQVDGFVSHC